MRIRQWMKHHQGRHQRKKRWRKMRRRGNDQRGRGHRRRETGATAKATGNTGEKSKIRKWEEMEQQRTKRGSGNTSGNETGWKTEETRGLRKCKRKHERRQESSVGLCWDQRQERLHLIRPAGVSPVYIFLFWQCVNTRTQTHTHINTHTHTFLLFIKLHQIKRRVWDGRQTASAQLRIKP